MKHAWEGKNPSPGTKYFKYYGCIDLRECLNCGAIQVKHSHTEWGRVTGYSWHPKVGKCKQKDNLTLVKPLSQEGLVEC